MLTLSTLAITYLAVGACLFLFYLVAFLRDRETPKTHLMSWIVLFVASIFLDRYSTNFYLSQVNGARFCSLLGDRQVRSMALLIWPMIF